MYGSELKATKKDKIISCKTIKPTLNLIKKNFMTPNKLVQWLKIFSSGDHGIEQKKREGIVI